MLEIPINTLAHYNKMPQVQLINLSSINTQQFASNVKLYREESGIDCPIPDIEAVQFYLFNHFASLIRGMFTPHEPMPDWATDTMQEYKRIVANQGCRLASYMALVTVRESRHMKAKEDEWWAKNIFTPYGNEIKHFHTILKAHEGDSMFAASMFENKSPIMKVGNFFGAIETIFRKGLFSGGYGGPKWANITKCLNEFLNGKTTQEMMIDTAYTLAHNNGPMFNKGMLYQNHTHDFLRILDIQRSGQIPEHVREHNGLGLIAKQKNLFDTCMLKLKDVGKFGEYVDWYKVKEAESVYDCSMMIAKQEKKYGKPKPVVPVVVQWEGKKAKVVGEFLLYPGVSIPVLERVEA